ncbi:MAG: lactonase family protein [Bryobacteraceae bacterium]
MRPASLSRRAFLEAASAISTSALLPMQAREFDSGLIDYVGTAESIDVYSTEAGQKRKLQSLASRHSSSLTLDTTGRHLFAVNEIDEFQGLPTSSVESYAVEPGTGHLRLTSRRPLSLSATLPKGLALSPNGQHLVVAVYGGGLYSVLSVRPNGEIDGVTQVIKEVGSSIRPDRQSSAHPHSVVFHPSGEFLIGTDSGADRINVFTMKNGHMTCVHRVSTVPGTGPAGLEIDCSGSQVFVAHRFSPLVARYRFDAGSGHLFISGDSRRTLS